MALRIATLLFGAVFLLSCTASGVFECTNNGQCGADSDGVPGACEAQGFCSFIDDTCASGRRFDELAGGGLSGDCLNAVIDAAVGSPDADALPTLADRGLLARYFIDEHLFGDDPSFVLDSAPSPLDLTIDSAANMSRGGTVGRGHLSWGMAGGEGSANAPVVGTKIQTRLEGTTSFTLEMVVDIQVIDPTNSRLSHIGTGTETGNATLASSSIDELIFYESNNAVGTWAVDLAVEGRFVLHLVVDTGLANPMNRSRLFVDGQPAPVLNAFPPGQGAALFQSLGAPDFSLGNRAIGGRSFEGELYYSAMYSDALNDAEIANNVFRLLATDDR